MTITNAAFANDIAFAYEYLLTVRERLNQRPDSNDAPLMPVDVRLELALRHLKDSVSLLREERGDIGLAFTFPARSRSERTY